MSYSSSGAYDYEVQAPPGYRVVSGHLSAGHEADGQLANVEAWGGFPLVPGDPDLHFSPAHGVHSVWRFHVRLSAASTIWFGVVCERSDEPDIRIVKNVFL